MANYYYVGSNGQQQGPVPASTLPSVGVNGETLVWTNGMAQWTKAKLVPELAQMFPATVPPVGGNRGFGGGGASMKPDNNMVWAILSTILCCVPIGIYAIICASRVNSLYNAGDYAGAQKAADDAMKWSKIGAGCGIAVGIIYFIAAVAGNM